MSVEARASCDGGASKPACGVAGTVIEVPAATSKCRKMYACSSSESR